MQIDDFLKLIIYNYTIPDINTFNYLVDKITILGYKSSL